MLEVPFNAVTLLIEHQEGHLASENLLQLSPKGSAKRRLVESSGHSSSSHVSSSSSSSFM